MKQVLSPAALEEDQIDEFGVSHYLDTFPNGEPMLCIGLSPHWWAVISSYLLAGNTQAHALGDGLLNVLDQYDGPTHRNPVPPGPT